MTERLAQGFALPFFDRGVMKVPALSLGHFWEMMAASVGPLQKLIERLQANPEQMGALRDQFCALAEPFYRHNEVHQGYLLTRAQVK